MNSLLRRSRAVHLSLSFAALFAACCASGSIGHVFVSQPTVFDRRTLLPQRIRESQWLENQLDSYDPDRLAGSTDVRTTRAFAAAASLGVKIAAPSLPATSADSDLQLPTGLPDPGAIVRSKAEISNLERLDDQVAYRERVWSRIHEQSLDDSHDLPGRALYELGFRAAVVPGRGLEDSALVVLQMSKGASDDDALFDAYSELRRRVRQEIAERRLSLLDWLNDKTKLDSADIERCASALRRGDQRLDSEPASLPWSNAVVPSKHELDRIREMIACALAWIEGRTVRDGSAALPAGASRSYAAVIRYCLVLSVYLDIDHRYAGHCLSEDLPRVPPANAGRVEDELAAFRAESEVREFGIRSADPVRLMSTVESLRADPGREFVLPAEAKDGLSKLQAAFKALERGGEDFTGLERALTAPVGDVAADQGQSDTRFVAAKQRIKARTGNLAPSFLGVDPPENAQNVSAVGARRAWMDLALAAGFTDGKIDLNTLTRYVRETQALAESIQRTPRLIAFGAGGEWAAAVLGPRFGVDGKGAAIYEHTSSQQSIAARVVVPVDCTSLKLRGTYVWITKDGRVRDEATLDWSSLSELKASRSFWTQSSDSDGIQVSLPIDLEALDLVLRNNASEPRNPRIDHVEGALVQGAKQQSILVRGDGLWRNPQVFIEGIRADRVDVLADMRTLHAFFEKAFVVPGDLRSVSNGGLRVVTSTGSDTRTAGVEIHPAPSLAPFLNALRTKTLFERGELEFEVDRNAVPPGFWRFTLALRPEGVAPWTFVDVTPLRRSVKDGTREIEVIACPLPNNGLDAAQFGKVDAAVLQVGALIQLTPESDPKRVPGTEAFRYAHFFAAKGFAVQLAPPPGEKIDLEKTSTFGVESGNSATKRVLPSALAEPRLVATVEGKKVSVALEKPALSSGRIGEFSTDELLAELRNAGFKEAKTLDAQLSVEANDLKPALSGPALKLVIPKAP